MEVITYNHSVSENAIDAFIESVNASQFTYTSFDLLKFGVASEKDINLAISFALQVCNMTNMPIKKHFKVCYLAGSSGLIKYWRLSKIGFKLALLNSRVINRETARMQLEIVLPSVF